MGQRGDLVPGRSLGEAAAVIVGAYSSSTSEAAQMSDSNCSNTAHLPIADESPCGPPPALQSSSSTEWGAEEAGDSDSL